MITFTNDNRIGGDPQLMNKFKSLVDLTRKIYKLTDIPCPEHICEIEEKFKKITGEEIFTDGRDIPDTSLINVDVGA